MVAVPSIGRAALVEPPLVAPEAFATHGLYERHGDRILAYCRHQLGSREEAEDAVQTTFLNAFRALRRGVVPESEAAWLCKIAENVCLSRRRSSWRRNRIESPADFEVIQEIVAGPSRQRDELIGLEDALAALPERQRRAILLREWQGLSYREIAIELDLSQPAVETLIFRARRSLAHGLTEPAATAPRRRGIRRALQLADLTTVLAAAKTLLTGTAAAKATTAAVAITALAGGAATVTPRLVHPPKPALAVPATSTPASTEAPSPTATPRAAAPTLVASAVPEAARPAARAAVVRRAAPARPEGSRARPAGPDRSSSAGLGSAPAAAGAAHEPAGVGLGKVKQPAKASEKPKRAAVGAAPGAGKRNREAKVEAARKPTREPAAPAAATPQARTDAPRADGRANDRSMRETPSPVSAAGVDAISEADTQPAAALEQGGKHEGRGKEK